MLTSHDNTWRNLDTLRALAVSAVLGSHWLMMQESLQQPWDTRYPLGHAGVIAFFVHTSLVLMLSLERMGGGAALRTVLSFYIRRAFRIYPLAIATVVLVLLLRIPVEPVWGATYSAPSTKVVLSNLFLVQNIIGKESVLGPLWSLPYEVQMYAVLPFCFFVAIRPNATRLLAAMLVGSLLLGWGVQTLFGGANLLAYIPCFLCGVLAYARRSMATHRIHQACWIPFLVTWFIAFTYYFPGDAASRILFRGGMSLLLALAIGSFGEVTSRPINSIAAWVAKYSYGIYLVHFPAVWAVRGLWHASTLFGTLAWLALTMALSVVAYHALEAPMIRLGRRLSRPK